MKTEPMQTFPILAKKICQLYVPGEPCVGWMQVSLMLHVTVPDLRVSTFGWMKCSHLFSMLWSYATLFIVYLWGLDLVTRYPASCRFLGARALNQTALLKKGQYHEIKDYLLSFGNKTFILA